MSHQIVSSIKLCRFPPGHPEYNPPPSPRVETVDCGDEAASWFSEFLGQPCRLIRQSPDFTRDMKKRPSGGNCINILPVLPGSYSHILELSLILCISNTFLTDTMWLLWLWPLIPFSWIFWQFRNLNFFSFCKFILCIYWIYQSVEICQTFKILLYRL